MSNSRNLAEFGQKVGDSGSLTLDSNGNVGIGDGAITATLDVHSTTAASEIAIEGSGGKWASIVSGTGTVGPMLLFDNTSSRFRIGSGSDKLGSGVTEHFVVDPSGNVGIGKVPVTGGSGQLNIGTPTTGGEIRFATDASSRALIQYWQTEGSTSHAYSQGFLRPGNSVSNDFVTSYWNGSAWTERMRIDSSGRITQPSQPCFHVYGPSSAPSHNTVINFQNTYVNVGSHYSTSNGRFTAPVAGSYMFIWSGIGSTANTVYRYYLSKNGSIANIGSGDVHYRQDGSTNSTAYTGGGTRSQIVYLNANDYVQILYRVDDTTSTAYYTSDYLNFGGYLIG